MSRRRAASAAASGSPLLDQTAEWLVGQALGEAPVGDILQGCCERLLAAGVPLWRAYLGYRTLHPMFASISLVWRRGAELGTIEHAHEEAFRSEAWLRSPLHHVRQRGLPFLRRRLTGPRALVDFELLEELRAEGGTDYLLFQVPFAVDAELEPGSDTQGVLGSWTTDRRGGFSDQDVRDLLRIQRRLAVASKVQIKDQVARNVLDTYLGLDAGARVLDGHIRRGDGERVHAVLWFSDMRDSTRLADLLPPSEFLDLVNDYFECTAGAVLDAGGEVLRFIGDAVLAIFPIPAPPSGGTSESERAGVAADGVVSAHTACARALEAARDAMTRIDALNERRSAGGEAPVGFGIALHVGDVLYGNIGVPRRLEFSVVGPAANEAARLEGLCKTLGQRVLLSEEFASRLPGPYRLLGRHALRGVGAPMEVFALREAASAAGSATAGG